MAGSSAAAAALRQLRLAARLSQEQLAARCQVSERTIRSLESGTAKRPHRDTLDAIARALELSSGAAEDFVASWRHDHRLMREVLAGRTPDDSVQAQLTALRRNVRELAIHESVHIDAAGRWRSMTVRRTFEVVGPGVDRFPWLVSADPESIDPALQRVTSTVNMTVTSELVLADAGAKAYIGEFGRELRIGETCSLEYTVAYEGAYRLPRGGPDDDEVLFAAGAGLAVLLIEVHFDPAALPVRAWRVRLPSVGHAAEIVEPLTVGPFGIAQCVVAPAPPGVHGMRWVWDEGHVR